MSEPVVEGGILGWLSSPRGRVIIFAAAGIIVVGAIAYLVIRHRQKKCEKEQELDVLLRLEALRREQLQREQDEARARLDSTNAAAAPSASPVAAAASASAPVQQQQIQQMQAPQVQQTLTGGDQSMVITQRAPRMGTSLASNPAAAPPIEPQLAAAAPPQAAAAAPVRRGTSLAGL